MIRFIHPKLVILALLIVGLIQTTAKAADSMEFAKGLAALEKTCPQQIKNTGKFTMAGDMGHGGMETLTLQFTKARNLKDSLQVIHEKEGPVFQDEGELRGAWVFADVAAGYPGKELVILSTLQHQPPFEPNQEGGHYSMALEVLVWNPDSGGYDTFFYRPRILELIRPYQPCPNGGALSHEGMMTVSGAVSGALAGKEVHYRRAGATAQEAIWHYNLSGDLWDDTYGDVKAAGHLPDNRAEVLAAHGDWQSVKTLGRDGMTGLVHVYLIRKTAEGYRVMTAVDHESARRLPVKSAERWGLNAEALKALGWMAD